MSTHLDEINVYLHENRMEIKSKSSKQSFACYELDVEEDLLTEVKTCKDFRIFYKKENSSAKATAADLRLSKVLPKLQSIDVFYCSVQPSDVLKFLKDSPIKVKKQFDFMGLWMPESERNALSTFMIACTEKYVRSFGIKFPFFWLWEYYKTRGKHIYWDVTSQWNLIENFKKLVDEGIPLSDADGVVEIRGAAKSNLKHFNLIFPEMIERGSVEVHTKRVGDKQIFDIELEKADGKKLFVKIDDNTVFVSNTIV